MRIATFNVESLDLPIDPRAPILRPALQRLEADILCLQEVNGQHQPGHAGRRLLALEELLEGTRYAGYNRAHTTSGGGLADVHNLVTLSRWPVVETRQVLHDVVPAPELRLVTAAPTSATATPIRFDRPILYTRIDVEGAMLHVINVHLRAPLAAPIPGGKVAPFVWASVSAWAEGTYVAGLKRAGQALELRLLIDQLFDADGQASILVTGDFNAEDHATPLRIVIGAPENTGNADLAARGLVMLDRAVDPARRFSVLHHGRPQMLDHMLASHGLYGRFRGIEVHNEALGDEAVGYAKGVDAMGSYHAAVVAEFKA